MFTGLVEGKSQLVAAHPIAGGKRLDLSHTFSDLELGESIAVSGACLTVVAFTASVFSVDLSNETLRLTTLGRLAVGDSVNLERALAVGQRLGGHLVTGHVDGLGVMQHVTEEGEMTRLSIRLPDGLSRYVARKGSLTVDGVSLTVNDVEGTLAHLLVIPHTRKVTTLGALTAGREVNLEVDLISRYVERLLTARGDPPNPGAI